MRVSIPYGRGSMTADVSDERVVAVLRPGLRDYRPEAAPEALIERAVARPAGGVRLSELARGRRRVVILASDHTRPVPSRMILPAMLGEIRRHNPGADVTILIATGCHRGTTERELEEKFGPEIARNERIAVHDCDDEANLADVGRLPSGGRCRLNRLAVEADLLVAEGFIEPHFFAGFSGGRKSVLPGIAARPTVMANHCAEFIAHPRARTGVLEGNPIHRDMLWAARRAGLAYILNVVLDEDKRVIAAVAGEPEAAHRRGCDFLSRMCRVEARAADIVVTGNGGYPLDQNIYQSVKGMTAAEACVRPGGVIVMAAQAADGHGGESFYRMACECADPEAWLRRLRSIGREQTRVDQWQMQIFARVRRRARIVLVSDAPPEMVRAMHMIPARTVDEALAAAERLLGDPRASVALIPDGVGVIVEGGPDAGE